MFRIFVFLLAVAFSAPASAQSVCGPLVFIAIQLTSKYGEEIVFEETRGESLWQVWASARTRTWTLTQTVELVMCIRGAGRDYGGWDVSDFLDQKDPSL